MLGEGRWFGHSSGSEYHMVVCGYLGGNPEIHPFFFFLSSFFFLLLFSSEAERNAKTREDLVSTTSGG